MSNDDINRKVQHFVGLAGAANDRAREEAEALFDEILPGVISMHAKVPPALRSNAVFVVADTQHTIAASVAREVMQRVSSAKSMMPEIGTGIVWFAQPRATIDFIFDAFDIPVPEYWSEPLEAGAIRLAFLLEDGVLYATDFIPSALAVTGGTA